MSLEDQVRFHEQLLHSIDSNLGKVTDDLAEVSSRLNQLTQVVQTMGDLMITIAERHDQAVARIERLEELFERWLRSQTDGHN